MTTHYDVLIAGAGISGIAAAYHLQTKCPGKSFAMLEARECIGGTWDLFRYPGIRSDSDMYTLGFSFRPWPEPDAIASGQAILDYVRETAAEFGIDKKIQFNTRVEHVSWSSAERRWTVRTRDALSDEEQTLSCNFFWACTGYYRYDTGYTPDFEGLDDFEGRVIHPQNWPSDLDYRDKKVVVIGSGATAMTLVPAMAAEAQHVTMLQRSPTYVFSVPQQDRIAEWLKGRLGLERAYPLIRWKNVLMGIALFQYTRRFPGSAKRFFVGQVRKALGDDFDVETHFNPSYNPWDERLCLVPDGDLFAAINDGKVSVTTDHIERFTPRGIQLRSGQELEADIIITATGLQLEFLGGATAEMDGEPLELPEHMLYKGMMLSDVPNMAFTLGYSNASWTLKAELTCEFVCELMKFMDKRGFGVCKPRPDPRVEKRPPMDLMSGYINRALDFLPTQGSKKPWRLYQNYLLDTLTLRHSRINDGTLEFKG